MKGLTFYDKQHIQKVLAQQSEVANIFNRFILSITPFLQQWADRSSDNVWLRNQVVENVWIGNWISYSLFFSRILQPST